MSYLKDVESLIGALQHGVLDPTQGWGQLEGLKDERVANRLARRTSQQEALSELLSSVQTTGYTAAKEGTDLSTLLLDPTIAQAQSQFGEDTLMSILSPYYRATSNPEAGSYGMSRLNTQLDPDDQNAILEDFYEQMRKPGADPEVARQAVQNRASQAYGPNVYTAIRGQIDELINDATKTTFGASY